MGSTEENVLGPVEAVKSMNNTLSSSLTPDLMEAGEKKEKCLEWAGLHSAMSFQYV